MGGRVRLGVAVSWWGEALSPRLLLVGDPCNHCSILELLTWLLSAFGRGGNVVPVVGDLLVAKRTDDRPSKDEL